MTALLEKPELNSSERVTLQGLLRVDAVVDVLTKVCQRQALDDLQRQQQVLRESNGNHAVFLAGKIELWNELMMILRAECKEFPTAVTR